MGVLKKVIKKITGNAPKSVKVRQVRSGIGCPRAMRETLKALGLRRIHQVVERHDTRELRGMVAKIPHLVEIVD